MFRPFISPTFKTPFEATPAFAEITPEATLEVQMPATE
jgi:hypothetical protein